MEITIVILFFIIFDLNLFLFLEKDFLLFWTAMSHVVLENCINCKFSDCVSVCPVDCFNEGFNFIVINPELCIDCAICVPECPVDAITDENNLKINQKIFLKINSDLSKIWPSIIKSNKNHFKERWIEIKKKLHLLKV